MTQRHTHTYDINTVDVNGSCEKAHVEPEVGEINIAIVTVKHTNYWRGCAAYLGIVYFL